VGEIISHLEESNKSGRFSALLQGFPPQDIQHAGDTRGVVVPVKDIALLVVALSLWLAYASSHRDPMWRLHTQAKV